LVETFETFGRIGNRSAVSLLRGGFEGIKDDKRYETKKVSHWFLPQGKPAVSS
jgi:hypothetical protein